MKDKNVLLGEKIQYLEQQLKAAPQATVTSAEIKAQTNNIALNNQLTTANKQRINNSRKNYAAIVNTTTATKKLTKDNNANLEGEQLHMMDKILNINEDLDSRTPLKEVTNDGFTVVRKKKRISSRPKNTIIGQNKKQATLRPPPPKRAWIYVGGCEKGTSTDTITEYIKNECTEIEEIECSELNTVGRLKSFQVGFNFEYWYQNKEI